MAKIIHFPTDGGREILLDLLDRLDKGEIPRFAVVAEGKEDGENVALTAWYNCDMGERQYLVSHLQVDIMWETVKVNLE